MQAKEMLQDAGLEPDSQLVILGGATVAGFFAAACSLPFDFVKTRIQEMPRLPDGTFPYKGFADCALKTAREEGLGRFYTGFPTYCARSVHHRAYIERGSFRTVLRANFKACMLSGSFVGLKFIITLDLAKKIAIA